MTTDETISHLNDLIAVARDGQQGYQTAAAHVDDTHLKTVFEQYSVQRAGFVRDLQAEVRRLGGDPATSGTVTAAMHRGWLDVKAVVTGGDAAALVAACETGEDAAQASYERVVNLDASGETRSIVDKQWRQVQEAHQRMLHLKRDTANA